MNNPTLHTDKITLKYGEHIIIKDLTLDISKPEIVTIIGPNGSGKSTLLKALCRLLEPAAGTVYLDSKNISWIACGRQQIDLVRACGILAQEFGVKRLAVVGGGHINAGFLAAGLLDEVSMLIGAGIDGRGGMAAVFDGLPMSSAVTQLQLLKVQQFDSDAVWLRYKVKK